MNARRRKRLADVARALSGEANELEDIVSEEQDCLDNMPENLQETDLYAEREDALDNLRDALEDLNSAIGTISGCI